MLIEGAIHLRSHSTPLMLYSVSLSPGSDVSTQVQLVSMCTLSLFLWDPEPVCAISLGASDLELRFANKRTTSLPGDDETLLFYFT